MSKNILKHIIRYLLMIAIVVVCCIIFKFSSDTSQASSNKSVNLVPSSNIVNAAQCAFVSLAENISTLVADKPYMSVVLVNCEPANEMYNDEKALGTWVSQAKDSVRKQKSHQSVKQASTWLKPGTKVSTGFSFFR